MVDQITSLPIPSFNDPQQYVSDLTKASGSSFLLPMLFLPKKRRQAMLALYAFCRETDDVVDEIEDKAIAKQLLEAWRLEVEALYTGKPTHPVTMALSGPVTQYGLEKKYFMEILNGFEMDRSGEMLRPSISKLELYCYRVASCVGLISINIFGYKDPKVILFAEHLGQAFQLTNILRDIAEDGARGRIYLPKEILENFNLLNVSPGDIIRSSGLSDACREVGKMARKHFNLAEELLPRLERRHMRPAILMKSVYEQYLNEMENLDFKHYHRRVRLGKMRKILLLCRGLCSTF